MSPMPHPFDSAAATTGSSKAGHSTVTVDVPASVLDALATKDGLFVKQRVDWVETVVAWEIPNMYGVYGWVPPASADPSLEEIKAGIEGDSPFAMTKEDPAGCCHRQLCGSARRWEMETKLVLPAGVSAPGASTTPLRFTRPFKCTFFCLARPVVYVWWGEYVIAEILSPFDCCEWRFEVGPPTSYPEREKVHPDMADAAPGVWYSVHAHMCTCGLIAPCCVAQAPFPIHAGSRSGDRVGTIARVFAGWCKEGCTNATNFSIAFPDGALPMQKASLLACTMLIDFLTSENNNKKNNNGGGGGSY